MGALNRKLENEIACSSASLQVFLKPRWFDMSEIGGNGGGERQKTVYLNNNKIKI